MADIKPICRAHGSKECKICSKKEYCGSSEDGKWCALMRTICDETCKYKEFRDFN
jgi:hypothetical protein